MKPTRRLSMPIAFGIGLPFLLLAQLASAADWYVDTAAASGGNGSISKPLTTIKAAIVAAAAGDRIRVAQGNYNEVLVVSKKNLRLEGGYLSSFVSRDPVKTPSSILGNGSTDLVSITDQGLFVIDGFRISGGARGIALNGGQGSVLNCLIENNTQPGTDSRGGGIYANNSSITISGNTIRNNSAGHGGGVAVANGGTIVISDNRIESNKGIGDHGGGMWIAGVNTTITRNYIASNRIMGTYGFGGGVIFFNDGNNANFSYNIITDNFAPSRGSGVFIDEGATALLEHELIYANQCGVNGGAGLMVDGATASDPRTNVTIRFSTIADNYCPNSDRGGAGIFVENNADLLVDSCILWGNANLDFHQNTTGLTVRYTSSESTFAGTGNILGNPLFANSVARDYHEKSKSGRFDPVSKTWVKDTQSSPTIDKGNPSFSCPSEPSPNGARVNMGAFANSPEASLSDSVASCGQPGDGGFIDGGGGAGGSAGSGGSAGVDSGTAGTGGAGVDSGTAGTGGLDSGIADSSVGSDSGDSALDTSEDSVKTDAPHDSDTKTDANGKDSGPKDSATDDAQPGIVQLESADGSCGCSVPGSSRSNGLAAVSLLAIAAVFSRKRRSRY